MGGAKLLPNSGQLLHTKDIPPCFAVRCLQLKTGSVYL